MRGSRRADSQLHYNSQQVTVIASAPCNAVQRTLNKTLAATTGTIPQLYNFGDFKYFKSPLIVLDTCTNMNALTYCKSIPPPNTLDSYNAAIGERPGNATDSNGRRKKRGVGEHTKFWSPGKTLKILVYKYNEHSFEAVKKGATKWLPHINLKFDFLELDEEDIYNSEAFLGDIRVDFQPRFNDGGSSRFGTDALTGSPHDASMSLGTNFSSPHYQRTVIHEFGHALGLHHEHQHPDAKIPWDREKTYSYYARAFGFSRQEVDDNVFPFERVPGKTYTPYDRQSVMHYKVLNELTIGDWHQAASMHISEGDIALVKKAYP